jgi:hypothetical protein
MVGGNKKETLKNVFKLLKDASLLNPLTSKRRLFFHWDPHNGKRENEGRNHANEMTGSKLHGRRSNRRYIHVAP